MARFRKKPVVIEAMQLDAHGENARAVALWAESSSVRLERIVGRSGYTLVVDTLEGPLIATPGDWIIRGVKGELYPCKPDIFERSYEAVD